MKNSLFYFFALISFAFGIALSISSQAQSCDLAQLISTQKNSDRKIFANAVPFQTDLFITNDHALGQDDSEIVLEILEQGRKIPAKIVVRDFHTDLAILKVNEPVMPCKFDGLQKNAPLLISTFNASDKSRSTYQVFLNNIASAKLLIPGIRSGLELSAQINEINVAKESMSGSALLQNGKVVGLVTQKSSEGTALAISSKDLNDFIQKGSQHERTPRRYQVDRKTGKFHFDGLNLSPKEQNAKFLGGEDDAEDTPKKRNRSSGGDPHEGSRGQVYSKADPSKGISFDTLNVGYAVAKVESIAILSKNQPHLAQALQENPVERIFIHSIDGQSVRSLFELLRVLGDCDKCEIDGFWLEVSGKTSFADPSLEKNNILGQLLLAVESQIGTQATQEKFLYDFQNLNRLFSREYNLARNNLIDQKMQTEIKAAWQIIELKLRQEFRPLPHKIFDLFFQLEPLIQVPVVIESKK